MATIKGIEVSSQTYDLEDETGRDAISDNTTAIGTLANLDTTAKTDLVSAINEVADTASGNSDKIGTLANLDTTAKTDLVSAINEVNGKVSDNWDYQRTIAFSGDLSGTICLRVKGDVCYVGVAIDDTEMTKGWKNLSFTSITGFPFSFSLIKAIIFTNGATPIGQLSFINNSSARIYSNYDSNGDEEGFDLRWSVCVNID